MSDVRYRQLDGLRAVAVALVLYAHFFATDGSYWGHVGVRLFFVLSGFLITRLLLDARAAAEFQPATALKSFYIRRSLRIFPPYFAMLALVWLASLEESRRVLAWHALYLSNFWYAFRDEWSPWVLVHTWSLSIEEQFYLVWPLVILLAPRRSIERICVGVIIFSLAFRLYWPVTGTPSLARDLLPPASMDALACGALLAAWRTRTMLIPLWVRVSWVPLATAFLVLLWLRPVSLPMTLDWVRWIGLEILPLVPLVMIVNYCATGLSGYAGRLAESRPLTGLGRISYGVYLFHALVLAFVVKAQPWLPVNVSEQGLGRFLVAGTGTLVVAAISWMVLEKRVNAFKGLFPYVVPKNRHTERRGSGRGEHLLPACLHAASEEGDALAKTTIIKERMS
ncbi:acyltransferase family protein [Phyllobacterium endophyticum]|uniref:Acyltransferase n=1 Tax=Phyllobacterium endophyticum TaxID=1149773 RepID=A0A2P7AZW7_9HYPH|nr:acyltransferase [Phyllobacterium endophyticum]MBB3235691.1 peptidoglycan/LPS O-acetylase OafA/YrhL [Phyllobacterium endophyticum]PSH59694.1 acyltransferase [Phyllobacterium endophyticum]TYR41839.1 acyltransferase [Phyllobacterium endophyticum]